MGDDVLELESRRRVFDAVRASPGLHVSDIAREAGLHPNHARYHLGQLARAGLVVEDGDGHFVRFYPTARTRGVAHNVLAPKDKALVQALRRPRALQLVAALCLHGDMALAALAQAVGRSRSGISFHLGRLAQQGIVVRLGTSPAERRYGLADPAAVIRLLALHPPRPGVVASFQSLWEGLAVPLEKAGRMPPGPAASTSDGHSGPPAAVHSGQRPPRGLLPFWRATCRLLLPPAAAAGAS